MISSHQREILKTLLYSDIFHYPLTIDELWRFTGGKMDKDTYMQALNNLKPLITREGSYYYLTGRHGMVRKREERTKESEKKIHAIKKSISLLSLIPTVVFIGVSGSVAMRNCKKEDDIDLFIIARKNTVWLSRLCILFLLQLTGKRRKRHDTTGMNQLCVNMLMSEHALTLSVSRHSLYTAHEVVRMMPVFERDDIYRRFLSANSWVKQYMPNSIGIKKLRNKEIEERKPQLLNYFITPLLSFFEPLAKWLQLWYMRGHRTTEEISDTLLAFHPKDLRPRVVQALEKRLEKYHL